MSPLSISLYSFLFTLMKLKQAALLCALCGYYGSDLNCAPRIALFGTGERSKRPKEWRTKIG